MSDLLNFQNFYSDQMNQFNKVIEDTKNVTGSVSQILQKGQSNSTSNISGNATNSTLVQDHLKTNSSDPFLELSRIAKKLEDEQPQLTNPDYYKS